MISKNVIIYLLGTGPIINIDILLISISSNKSSNIITDLKEFFKHFEVYLRDIK